MREGRCDDSTCPSHIFDLHFFMDISGYFLAMMTARIGAGSPSIVLL